MAKQKRKGRNGSLLINCRISLGKSPSLLRASDAASRHLLQISDQRISAIVCIIQKSVFKTANSAQMFELMIYRERIKRIILNNDKNDKSIYHKGS